MTDRRLECCNAWTNGNHAEGCFADSAQWDLPALSINQPWSWAIVHGAKDIENRDWATRFRGRFLIHAGLKYDRGDDAFVLSTAERSEYYPAVMTGGIIGVAEIVDCVSESTSPWFFGRYGFVIRNARPLPFRPCKGRLGFFKPDYESRYAVKSRRKSGGASADLFEDQPI